MGIGSIASDTRLFYDFLDAYLHSMQSGWGIGERASFVHGPIPNELPTNILLQRYQIREVLAELGQRLIAVMASKNVLIDNAAVIPLASQYMLRMAVLLEDPRAGLSLLDVVSILLYQNGYQTQIQPNIDSYETRHDVLHAIETHSLNDLEMILKGMFVITPISLDSRRTETASAAQEEEMASIMEDWRWIQHKKASRAFQEYYGLFIAVVNKVVIGSGVSRLQLRDNICSRTGLRRDRIVISYIEDPNEPLGI